MKRFGNLMTLALIAMLGSQACDSKTASESQPTAPQSVTASAGASTTSGASAAVAVESATPAPTATATDSSAAIVTAQPTATTAAATPNSATISDAGKPKRVYQAFTEIVLKPGDNVEITDSSMDEKEMLDSPQMKTILGDVHVLHAGSQDAKISGIEAELIYFEFASESDAETAAKKLLQWTQSDPEKDGTILVYGKFVVGAHTDANAQQPALGKALQALLD